MIPALCLAALAAAQPQDNPSKDPKTTLKTFQTIFVDARSAVYFGREQMQAALAANKDFAKLGIQMVDNRQLADTVLEVGHTFAWDYPFKLTHSATFNVLLAGKGSGPFSGPLGAEDVARQLVKLLKPYRTVPEERKK